MRFNSLALFACLAACGDDTRCPTAGSSSDSAPRLVDLEYLYQLPEDPSLSIFRIEFEDPDGNLGSAFSPPQNDLDCQEQRQHRVEAFVNGKKPAVTSCTFDPFRAVGLPHDARRGLFAFHLRFSQVDPGEPATFWLGVQLIDGESLRSNCLALELEVKAE